MTFLNRSIGRIIASASLTALLGSEATAQDPAAQGAAAQDEVAGIAEIIVSARRRDESIQETPIAMTAVVASQLESTASVRISDIQGIAPNLVITQQSTGAGAVNMSIRGLGFADIEKSFDPTVAVVIDGIFIGTSTGQLLDFFDMESIEVMRGPQGTLFGRNTIGGVINIRRTRPTGEFGGKIQVEYGRYETKTVRSVLNVPLVDGKMAAKGWFFVNDSGGYLRNGLSGDRVGGNNNKNYGASLSFTPTGSFDALLTVEQQEARFDTTVFGSITKTGELFCLLMPANQCNRNNTKDIYEIFTDRSGEDSLSTYRAPAVTLEMNLDAGPVKLTSVTGYRKSREGQTEDVDGTSSDIYWVDRRQKYRQFSQEIRGAGKFTDTFDYVIGGYYFASRYNLFQTTEFFGALLPIAQDTTGHSTSAAVFGDFNWALADRWRLSFGGRYTHDNKKLHTIYFADFGKVEESWSKFTPKVGLDYRLTDDVMLYASWSRGYRAGGFSGRGLGPLSATTPFGPEAVDSYEAGLKSSWLDRRLQLNIAGFYTDYKDIQQSTTIPTAGGTGNETIVTNAASAKVKGIELDFTAVPVENLTIRGSFSLTDAKFGDFLAREPDANFVLQPVDYSDVGMIYAPKVTGSVGFEYTVPVGFGEWHLNGTYRHIGEYDQQIARDAAIALPTDGSTFVVGNNDARVRSNAQNLIDASLSLSFEALQDSKARVGVYVRNLTDNRGPASSFTVGGLWSFSTTREPRTYGVQVGFDF